MKDGNQRCACLPWACGGVQYSVKRIMGWWPGGGPGLGQAGQRGESCRGGVSETIVRQKAHRYSQSASGTACGEGSGHVLDGRHE